LHLFFCVEQQVLDRALREDLVPGGASIPVTNANRVEYIFRLAHHRLNKQIATQCSAFMRGASPVSQRCAAGQRVASADAGRGATQACATWWTRASSACLPPTR
jgi:hypothetical protein